MAETEKELIMRPEGVFTASIVSFDKRAVKHATTPRAFYALTLSDDQGIGYIGNPIVVEKMLRQMRASQKAVPALVNDEALEAWLNFLIETELTFAFRRNYRGGVDDMIYEEVSVL